MQGDKEGGFIIKVLSCSFGEVLVQAGVVTKYETLLTGIEIYVVSYLVMALFAIRCKNQCNVEHFKVVVISTSNF